MSKGGTSDNGRTGEAGVAGKAEAATGSGDAGQPTLREFIHGKVSDLFSRLDGDECDGLYRLVIHEVEGSLLEAVMRETAGNQGRAARILGVNRGTLRKKLRAHRLIRQAPQPTGGGGG